MKSAVLRLLILVPLLSIACDAQDQCVADCDTVAGSAGSSGSSGAAGSSGTPTTDGALVCADVRDEATAFILQNRDCETVLDCVAVVSFCYEGEVSSTCGEFGASANYDMDAWQAISDDLDAACGECGANPCGSPVMCNDAQECEAVFSSPEYCPSIARDIETFLEANAACEVDEDCKELPSSCHVNNECSGVIVNVDTSAEDWQQLDQTLQLDCSGSGFCNLVGDCGVQPRCSDDGLCVAGV